LNQLFNTVNYFEFQAFEALRRWKPPGLCIAHIFLRFLFLTFSFSLLTFPIVPGNKKAAEAFLRTAAFG